MNEFATKEELDILTSKFEALEIKVKETFINLNTTLKDVADQCHDIKNDYKNSAQDRINNQKLLAKIDLAINDDDSINHVGVLKQLKNNHLELKKELEDHKEEHNALGARVTKIETDKDIDKKVSKLKTGLIYGGFTAIGGGLKPAISWVIDKIF